MTTIQRIAGANRGRSRAVIHDGRVYTVATDTSSSGSVAEQTRRALAAIDANLAEAGTDKNKLLQATVYLRDMTTKDEMDAVWCAWIGAEENWPQRACVGTDLAGADLVEIVIIAAID